MDAKTKARIIRHYDVEALMRDIKTHQANIISFTKILEKAVKRGDEKNIKAYSEAVKKTEKDIQTNRVCGKYT